MRKILALDVGGTSTRAVVLDTTGRALSFARAGGGNPTSVGADWGLTALSEAAERAIAADPSETDPESTALIALAGAETGDFLDRASARFAALGYRGGTSTEGDLLGTFFSGTVDRRGYAMIAGTGTIAARIDDGRMTAISGGTGWLLGDAGSGYWIGHQVTRAAVADVDGNGPATALTPLFLRATGLEFSDERTGGRSAGRSVVVRSLVDTLYQDRPIALARFAPLAFQAREDPIAADILERPSDAIAALFRAVLDPLVDGPLVLGGTVLGALMAEPSPLRPRLAAAAASRQVLVPDGLVGAAILGLKHAGIHLDSGLFETVRSEVARVRDAASFDRSTSPAGTQA